MSAGTDTIYTVYVCTQTRGQSGGFTTLAEIQVKPNEVGQLVKTSLPTAVVNHLLIKAAEGLEQNPVKA